jgi:uncharacterized protein
VVGADELVVLWGVDEISLDREVCLGLLATQSLGRLIFTQRALPDVLPVRYRLEGEGVLIPLAVGSAAAAACLGSVVAFEVDHFDPRLLTGWSVTLVGQGRQVTRPVTRQVQDGGAPAALSLGDTEDGDLILWVAAQKITGHDLSSAGPDPRPQFGTFGCALTSNGPAALCPERTGS